MTEELTAEELAFLQSAFELARSGDTEQLEEYVDAGLPVNLTNSAGDTLLILAAYHRHAELVDALLMRGADHARVNDRGQTALACATFRQDVAIVQRLLAAGADPELGPRSAVEIARFFDLPDLLTVLRGS